MKNIIIGGLLFCVSFLCYGQASKTYKCDKGNQVIYYRISFKGVRGEAPCKVYEKYLGRKTKRIAFSEMTAKVCEDTLTRTLIKCEKQGMICTLEGEE